MADVQALSKSLSDPRLFGTYLYAPIKWLCHEVSQIPTPLQGTTFGEKILEVCQKIVQLALIIFIPFALFPAACGLVFNFYIMTVHGLPSPESSLPPEQPDLSSFQPILSSSSHPSLKEILNEEKKLRRDYEKVFQNLEILKGDSGKKLEERFDQLSAKLSPYREDAKLSKQIRTFEEMRQQFKNLREKRALLFHIPLIININTDTIPVPDKGDCLYEAIARALYVNSFQKENEDAADLSESALNYPVDPKKLRQEAVEWERNHLEQDTEIKKLITESITSLLFDMRSEIEKEREELHFYQSEIQQLHGIDLIERKEMYQAQIDKSETTIQTLEEQCTLYKDPSTNVSFYLQNAAKDKVWGTEAEIYAIAQIYQIGIHIQTVVRTYSNDERRIQTDVPINVIETFPERPKQIKLKNINGTHYEPWFPISSA